jgi:hypothetical protein
MIGTINKIDAIMSLKPNAKFSWSDDVINWYDSEQTEPTESQINTEIARLQAIEDYQAPRRAEYPSIGDQLDMIYRNGDGGAEFQAAIKAIKDKYPKP